jgi:hypothetical protein
MARFELSDSRDVRRGSRPNSELQPKNRRLGDLFNSIKKDTQGERQVQGGCEWVGFSHAVVLVGRVGTALVSFEIDRYTSLIFYFD